VAIEKFDHIGIITSATRLHFQRDESRERDHREGPDANRLDVPWTGKDFFGVWGGSVTRDADIESYIEVSVLESFSKSLPAWCGLEPSKEKHGFFPGDENVHICGESSVSVMTHRKSADNDGRNPQLSTDGPQLIGELALRILGRQRVWFSPSHGLHRLQRLLDRRKPHGESIVSNCLERAQEERSSTHLEKEAGEAGPGSLAGENILVGNQTCPKT
jgi:hypothetical protein